MRPLLALLAILLTGPALAEPVVRLDTELLKGRCRFIADDGEVGHYAETRCPGHGGVRVHTVAGVHDVELKFAWGKGKPQHVVEGGSLGDKIEWRGHGKGAAFKPHGAIVRVIAKDFETEARYDILAVIRVETRRACLMAVIDEKGNTNALELARTTADGEAPAYKCPREGNTAKVIGAPSWWAQTVIGLPADPPE